MYKLKNHKLSEKIKLEICYENWKKNEEFWRNFDSFLVQNSCLTWISVSFLPKFPWNRCWRWFFKFSDYEISSFFDPQYQFINFRLSKVFKFVAFIVLIWLEVQLIMDDHAFWKFRGCSSAFPRKHFSVSDPVNDRCIVTSSF